MSTPYHAKLFAYELSRRHPSNDADAVLSALFDASVDLNPHQVEAALFAIRSPISKGSILADEVGLGKTIEAGIVLCQLWAERRRRLLVICPASLRKQWAQELAEKFHLPSVILDARSFKAMEENGYNELAAGRSVIITSYHFAHSLARFMQAVAWDTVVIDEAHKLRNCYRQTNKIGQSILNTFAEHRKLLLTATPFQNSLLELYGLATLIDPLVFGDVDAFKALYASAGSDLTALRARLAPLCTRTLRKQVKEYVRYTNRIPLTQSFTPTFDETRFYDAVTRYLQNDDSYGISGKQRHLTALVLFKLLASSTHAIRGTLSVIQQRLQRLLTITNEELPDGLDDELLRLLADDDLDSELIEALLEQTEPNELSANADESNYAEPVGGGENLKDLVIRRQAISDEIATLQQLIDWSSAIHVDAKTTALLTALQKGFAQLQGTGAQDKALIFTESRRTQDYLIAFLEANGYRDQVVAFNGGGGGQAGTAIYQQWLQRYANTDRVTGSRSVDQRTALIDHFRDNARIMIATEAAAEGVNLQFCSLVINYDLPWNPQRIEQRIGRCHRYGQLFDVVVVNFLNGKNRADERVLALLTEKFQLFSGMFGASDEVLGAVESGLDFESRIAKIMRSCRSAETIDTAFAALQLELDTQIHARLDDTRQTLLEHFDEDVHARLKLRHDATALALDQVARRLWVLLQLALHQRATFDEQTLSFALNDPPTATEPIATGTYGVGRARRVTAQHQFRLASILGQWMLDWGKQQNTPVMSLRFDVTNHTARIALVEAVRGRAGWLRIDSVSITGFADEDHVVLSGITDDGASLDPETCSKLFHCVATITAAPSCLLAERLSAEATHRLRATIAKAAESDRSHFNEARDQLDRWAEAQVLALEKELNDTKNRMKGFKREERQAESLDDSLRFQREIQRAESDLRRQRQAIFTREDEIAVKRDGLIAGLERRLKASSTTTSLFTIHFTVV